MNSGDNDHSKSDAFIFFGATGDLAKKQIFPALQDLVEDGVLDFPIVGSARSDWTDDRLISRAKESLQANNKFENKNFSKLCSLMSYIGGDLNEPEVFKKISDALRDSQRPIIYMAVPPSMFATTAQNLATFNCLRGGRLLIEKPFGSDLKSARRLNKTLHKIMSEKQIFRIDHYLGKEAVENLAHFHQTNSLFRAAWSHKFIDHIQITMAEKFGVSDRGKLYDSQGTIRDVVQNHLLQIVANLLIKHDASNVVSPDARGRDSALQLISEASLKRSVFGQFESYTKVDGVESDSKTETFVVLKILIEAGRLKGVPIFLRAGKRLPTTSTRVDIVFKPFPKNENDNIDCLTLFVTPDEKFSLVFNSSDGRQQSNFVDEVQPIAPYTHLFRDAILGDKRHFTDQKGVERCWEIVDPLLKRKKNPTLYKDGSWALSDQLCPPGGWR